jgi:hypothetical protein
MCSVPPSKKPDVINLDSDEKEESDEDGEGSVRDGVFGFGYGDKNAGAGHTHNRTKKPASHNPQHRTSPSASSFQWASGLPIDLIDLTRTPTPPQAAGSLVDELVPYDVIIIRSDESETESPKRLASESDSDTYRRKVPRFAFSPSESEPEEDSSDDEGDSSDDDKPDSEDDCHLKNKGKGKAGSKPKVPGAEQQPEAEEGHGSMFSVIVTEPATGGGKPETYRQTFEELISGAVTGYHLFRGSMDIMFAWLTYLEAQMPGYLCCLGCKDARPLVSYFYRKTKGRQGLVVNKLEQAILDCAPGTRFRVTTLHMQVRGGWHGNALIYDKQTRVLSRFEPHGAKTTSYEPAKLDEALRKYVLENPEIFSAYEKPSDFCPEKSVQHYSSLSKLEKEMREVFGRSVSVEAGGFCGLWSLYYMHARIVNPYLTTKQVVDQFSNDPDALTRIIRAYGGALMRTIVGEDLAKKKTLPSKEVVRQKAVAFRKTFAKN